MLESPKRNSMQRVDNIMSDDDIVVELEDQTESNLSSSIPTDVIEGVLEVDLTPSRPKHRVPRPRRNKFTTVTLNE